MLFLQCPECYALFYSLDIRNLLCRGVKLVQTWRRLQCAYKILRNRSSRSTRGHENSSVYYVFDLSFSSFISSRRLENGKKSCVFQLQCNSLTIWTRNLAAFSTRVWIVIQMQGAFKQTFRRRCINYCSFESVLNRFLWNIMGFIRQQFCSVCRSKLTFRCCQHSTVLFKYRICCRLVQTSDIPNALKN